MRRFKIETEIYMGAPWYTLYSWQPGWLWGGSWKYETAGSDKQKLRALAEHLYANPPEEFSA
jgi:hypothetical protein